MLRYSTLLEVIFWLRPQLSGGMSASLAHRWGKRVSKPQSLRNIPPDALQYAVQICARTGLSMSDVFRLALLSGCLVELTKVAPDGNGNYGEVDAQVLAKTLRRHLASAIDFLVEHGQHPYQGMFQGGLET